MERHVARSDRWPPDRVENRNIGDPWPKRRNAVSSIGHLHE